MWHEVKGNVDAACRVLEEALEESGEPYPADVYLLMERPGFHALPAGCRM